MTDMTPVAPTFTATFTITPTAVRTKTVGELTDVVKEIDWTMKGELDGQNFELPQTTILAEPEPGGFIPFGSLTKEELVSWIEASDTRIDAIKAHIQFVLDKQFASASLTSKSLPWEPAPEVVPGELTPGEVTPTQQ